MLGKGDPELDGGKLDWRVDITFISVVIRSLPALTMFNPESIQMMWGVPLNANILLNLLVMLLEL